LAELPKACQQTVGAELRGPFLGVPLCGAGRSRGVLYLMRGGGEASFSNDDEELLGSVGSWLEQANLSEEARLLNRLRVMNQVAQAAAGNLDLSSILAITLRELDRLLPLHICAVWLLEGPEQAARKAPETAPALSLFAASSTSGDKAASLGLLPGL